MNFCPHCGTKIDEAGKFCQACGQPLAVEAEAAPSFKQSFSQLKQLAPNRANFNRVIGFMHANFFLLHAVYFAIFIIALIFPWSGLVALLLAALGIYLYGALHSSDEIGWNRKVKEVIMAVGENREFDHKKDVMDPVPTPFTNEVAPEAPVTEPDTFDQMDVAANIVVEPDNNLAEPFEEAILADDIDGIVESDPELLATLERDIEADLEAMPAEELNELEEQDELEELNELEELGALEEMERLEAGEVIVAPEGEAEIHLNNPEEPKI